MTPLYGRLAQVMGRKGAMLLAVSLFFGESPLSLAPLVRYWDMSDYRLNIDAAAGTMACAIAPSMLTILVARGVAGMGSGGILTVTVRFSLSHLWGYCASSAVRYCVAC